jgi:integrating conjugative element protein (TIGR03761 family)
MANQANQNRRELAGSFKYVENPTIQLITNVALFLWNGRERTENKAYIMSMPELLRRVRNMESAIQQDDPWADKTYLALQEAIDEAEHAFQAKKEELEAVVEQGHSRISFPSAVTKSPVEREIVDHSRLGFRVLEVLALADDTARLILEAQHRGRIDAREKVLLVKSVESIFRAMMSHVSKWRYFGVTRDDVAGNTQPAQKAKAAFGEIEQEYLDGSLRSKFAPELPKKRQKVSQAEAPVTDDEIEAEVAKMTAAAQG